MKIELWVSLVVVVVALFLMSVRRDRGADGLPKPLFKGKKPQIKDWLRLSRLTAGADNRDSTSKTVVLGWTVVVAWLVVSCILQSKGVATSFAELMTGLDTPYFAVLGGPVLAAFLAKAVVSSKTSGDDPSLQKTEAAKPGLSDLVTTDSGGVSVADAQYLVLNLCAVAYVVYAFAKQPSGGIPNFPEQLALLTGGSAATYAGTKGWTANAPQITAMTPTKAAIGGDVAISIRGVNLVAPGRAVLLTDHANGDDGKKVTTSKGETRVTIGGWQVPPENVRARSEEVVVTALPIGLVANVDGYDVSIVTAAGLKTTAPDPLIIV